VGEADWRDAFKGNLSDKWETHHIDVPSLLDRLGASKQPNKHQHFFSHKVYLNPLCPSTTISPKSALRFALP
jgi:hypothetical protein